MGEEQQILTALALLGGVILGQCQQKLEGNRDVCRITEVAVLKINEASKIRELYRAIGEIPETEKERNAGKRQEVEEEWNAMWGISEVRSANQTHQLEAMRFEMKSKNPNLPSSKIEEVLENEMQRARKEIPKETYNNTATRPGKSKSMQLKNAAHLYEFLSLKCRMGIIGRMGIWLRNGE